MADWLWDCFAVLGIVSALACMFSGLSLAGILYAQFRQERLNAENAKILVGGGVEPYEWPNQGNWDWEKARQTVFGFEQKK